MPSKLPVVLLLVALAGALAFWALSESPERETAPQIETRETSDDGSGGTARTASGRPGADGSVTRVERSGSATDDPDRKSDSAGTSADDASLMTRFRGQVLDARTGEPVVGAQVSLMRSSDSEDFAMFRREMELRDRRPGKAETGPEGRFDFGAREDWLAGDQFRLRVRSELHLELTTEPGVVRLGEDNEFGLLRVVPAPLLTVQVVDEQNNPIDGVELRLFDSGGPDIEIIEGAEPDSGEITTSFSFTTSRLGEVESETISSPIEGLMNFDRRARLKTWKTDARGLCQIPCEPGEVAVRAQHARFAPTEARVIMPDQGSLTEVVVMQRAANLEVFVTDDRGEPVSGKDVEVITEMLGRVKGTTDPDGIARFDGLPLGMARVRLAKRPTAGVFLVNRVTGNDSARARPTTTEVQLFAGQTSEVRLTAKQTATASITVTVDGEPLPGARLSVRKVEGDPDADQGMIELEAFLPGQESQRTDENGEIVLGGLEPGANRFTVRHQDLALAARREAVLQAGDQDLRLDFQTSRIVGRVLGPDGTPQDGADVELTSASSGSRGSVGTSFVIEVAGTSADSPATTSFSSSPAGRTTTDVDGSFELRIVPVDEELVVKVRSDAGRGEFPGKVVSAPGQRVDLGTLTLTSVGRAEIHVVSESQISVVVAQRLDASGETVGNPVVRPAQNGQATFPSLMPGTWRFRLGFGNGAPSVDRTIYSGRTTTFDLGG